MNTRLVRHLRLVILSLANLGTNSGASTHDAGLPPHELSWFLCLLLKLGILLLLVVVLLMMLLLWLLLLLLLVPLLLLLRFLKPMVADAPFVGL